jgi:hypothetical protein
VIAERALKRVRHIEVGAYRIVSQGDFGLESRAPFLLGASGPS